MKIAFVYGSWSSADRPFDFNNLFDDPRGLTGSESSCFLYAKEVAKRHEVFLFADYKHQEQFHVWNNIKLIHTHEYINVIQNLNCDVVISWNEPQYLKYVNVKTLRVVNQQLNDFGYCEPGFNDYVDVFTSPNEVHKNYLLMLINNANKWTILPNGCDINRFSNNIEKVNDRIIYTSSPDRGLHWLLYMWPKIKNNVKTANLHVFYEFDKWFQHMSNVMPYNNASACESALRATYINYCFKQLNELDVEHHKSISYNQMSIELSKSQILAYPCDTMRFTEGFSVSLMEGCAAGLFPITTDIDSLKSIYGSVVPMVDFPIKNNLDKFIDILHNALKNIDYKNDVCNKVKDFAKEFDYKKLSINLENMFIKKIKELK